MRRGAKFNPTSLPVVVPDTFAEWAYEYKIGYDDGQRKKPFAYSPPLGDFAWLERKAAYDAGRAAGKKGAKGVVRA